MPYATPQDYRQEQKDVSTFLDKHLSHAGVIQSLKWLQEWLDDAASGNKDAIAGKDIARLAEKEVSPLDILKAISAVWLYSYRYPRRLPNDVSPTLLLNTGIPEKITYIPAPLD